MSALRVVTILGTRPEVIKLAPVIREFGRDPSAFDHKIVTTAQHREMLDQVLAVFGITPDVDLGLMQQDQSLTEFASRALVAVSKVLAELQPQVVIIQGDTTTVMAAALAAFHQAISVAHVEAGLRSFDCRNPFPEEMNRRLTSCLTDLHFAPTQRAKNNLLKEGVPAGRIFVTGNTIVDALKSIPLEGAFEEAALNGLCGNGTRTLLVTAHRRENHGEPLQSICRALTELVERFNDVEVIYPVHLNPNVRQPVTNALAGIERIHLVEPLSYIDLLRLMKRCYLVLTDSGGIQEEAPSFGKPVLVLRKVTERPEVLEANAGRLVGTDTQTIVDEASRLLTDSAEYARMSAAKNPFGDGHAAERIVSILSEKLESSARL